MEHTNNIVSFSGGKDSTAMLLMMIARRIPIHSVMFFDTGWEFPEILDHIDLIERKVGVKIWRVYPKLPFDYCMTKKPVKDNDGHVKHVGWGWPSATRCWCAEEKIRTLSQFVDTVPNAVEYIGYAVDEKDRNLKIVNQKNHKVRFPLQEWMITKKDALQYCYSKGCHWNGLYKHFARASCFCCPSQRVGSLRKLWKYYPALWKRMVEMEENLSIEGRQNPVAFKSDKTVSDFTKLFTLDEYGYSIDFTAETLKLLSDSCRIIKIASKLVEQIDWLYSGDTGEGTAHYDIPLLLNEILTVLEVKEKYEP